MLKTRPEPGHFYWQGGAAIACFVMAVVAGTAGSLLTSDWILDAQRHPAVYMIGVTLLILTLPILLLGGHCLDLMDRKRKKSEAAEHYLEA